MKTIPLVDLKAQYLSLKPEIDAAIARVIEAGVFILGPEAQAFEAEFAALCEVDHCIACGNGTDALFLALKGLGVGPGDEVITASLTFIATAEAISMTGATPVFVDVCADTLCLDPQRVPAAITHRTKAIVPVHLYGQPADMEALLSIARARGLLVVEDAAQAVGARVNGRRAGSMGDAAIFSFYPGKNLGAYGDAGAVVTRNRGLAEWLRMARDHGRTSKYLHAFEGQSSRLDALQAAVLRVKLPHVDRWNRRRRTIAARYDNAVAGCSDLRPTATAPGCESSHHLYVLRADARDDILARMRDVGVHGGIHYPVPLHQQQAYARLTTPAASLPVSEDAGRTVFSLPLYPEMSDGDVNRVIDAVLRASGAQAVVTTER